MGWFKGRNRAYNSSERLHSTHKEIDFYEALSPSIGVVDALRPVLGVSFTHRWKLRALNFTQAYLNAKVLDDIWLERPDGEVVKACNVFPIFIRAHQSGVWSFEGKTEKNEGAVLPSLSCR